MKKITLSLALLLTLFLLAACGGNTPQTPPATDAPTETLEQPTALPASTDTAIPATETATETALPATEAVVTTTVSYAASVKPIFDAKCIKCHGIESTKEGLDMQTYENVMAGSRNGTVITPGDAANSVLVDLIIRGKMPNRGAKLSDEEIQIITDWVNQGALNN